MELTIRDGNFYRGDELVKPEIGNVEQIRCLKAYERLKNDAKSGIQVNTYYETVTNAEAYFLCICGKRVFHSIEDCGGEDDEVFDEVNTECRHCKAKYKFEIDDDGDLIAKIK